MKPTQHTPCHRPIKVGDLDYTAEQINQLLSLIPYKADRKEISALISFTGQNYIGHYPSSTLLKPQDRFAWALVGSLSAAAPYFFYTAGNEPEGYTAGWNNMQPVFGTYDLAQEDKEDEITSEDFMRIPLHLPLLTADRAIADEHGNRIADTYETRQAVRNHIRAVYNEQFIENPPLILDEYITPGMLSEGVKDMLSQAGATITNVPDGEDLTTKQGVLKLSDKPYNPGAYSGLGRIYLRKNLVGGQNLLTQAMVSKPNTIYILQYDYTLDGKSITIPEGCVLSYEGGSIRDGHINYTDTLIEGKESLNNVTEAGASIHHDNEERKLSGQGMDCIILKKTPYLTQNMVSKPNTIYIIRYNYDLNGAEITIPEGCVLDFQGGSLNNGSIIGNNTAIKADLVKIFGLDINLLGSWNVSEAYPEWFGAVGDGINDDTIAFRKSIVEFNNNIQVKIVLNDAYHITESLITSAYSISKTVYIEIEGSDYIMPYNVGPRGSIIVDGGVNIFCDKTFRGYLKSIKLSLTSEAIVEELARVDGSVFYNSTLRGFVVENNNISLLGSIFYNTDCLALTKIIKNTFTYINAFAKCEATNKSWDFVDSLLEGNYINGGGHNYRDDNDCFNWGQWNGSTIINNFIDYYRCIFNFVQNTEGNIEIVINSTSNHYQVFKYLYNAQTMGGGGTLHSVNDVINHTNYVDVNPMIPFKYNNGISEIDVPNNIVWIRGSYYNTNLNFVNLQFQNNCLDTFVFAEKDMFQAESQVRIKGVSRLGYNPNGWNYINVAPNYNHEAMIEKWEHPAVDIDIAPVHDYFPTERNYLIGERITIKKCVYRYMPSVLKSDYDSCIVKPRWIKQDEQLLGVAENMVKLSFMSVKEIGQPVFIADRGITIWNGERWVDSNGCIYTSKHGYPTDRPKGIAAGGVVNVLNPNKLEDLGFVFYDYLLEKHITPKSINSETGEVIWKEYDGVTAGVSRIGTFDQKPLADDIYNGFPYFCTDRKTPEAENNGIIIYHKEGNVWVDALGRVIN